MAEISGTPQKFNYSPDPLGGTDPDPKKPGSGKATGVGSGSGHYGYDATGGGIDAQPKDGLDKGPEKASFPGATRNVGIANFPNMMRTGDKAAGKKPSGS